LVATCAGPVELLLAAVPDAHGPTDRAWGLYAGLMAEAGIREGARVDHPDVTCGTLRGPSGGLVTLTNHGPVDLRVGLHLPAEASAIRRFGLAGVEPLGSAERDVEGAVIELDLPATGFAIVGWNGRV
jgi:hypothetical protein